MRELMTLALNRSGVSAIVLRDSGDFVFVANLPDCWTVSPSVVPNHRSVFGEQIGDRLLQMGAETMRSGEAAAFEASGPDERYFEFGLDRVSVTGSLFLLLTVIELTEERRREQRLRALLRELSHRSKNLLAIILSVASQTARSTLGLNDFLPKFRGRVYSISHSQDLITEANWHGVRFRDLVRAQADKYHDRPEEALTLTGENPVLSPNEALHVGLAIHELFVDAIAIGETCKDFPRIIVSCVRRPYDGRAGLEIVWRQTNPVRITKDEITATKSDGFHSTVLNRIAPAAIGGEGHYESKRAGPFYRIRFPQSERGLTAE